MSFIFNSKFLELTIMFYYPFKLISDKLNEEEKDKHNKFKALEDLDVLGDLLKKENLQRTGQGHFSK